MPYQSSKLFGALKITDESIKGNYSSSQYINVLDNLLYGAIAALIGSSNWINQYMAHVMSWYATNSRRKISNVSKDKLLTLMMLFILQTDPDEKMRTLRKMRIERSLLFTALNLWLEHATVWAPLHVRELREPTAAGQAKLMEIRRVLRPNNKRDLYCAIQEAGAYTDLALTFKAQLIEKYHRSIIMEAKALYVKSAHRFNLDDLIQDLMLATSKAIDKYDSDRGTLTPYIQHWWTHTKNTAWDTLLKISSETSLDHHIEQVGDTLATDDDVEATVVREQEIARVRQLALAVDPTGLGRIYLGIGTN